LNAVDYDLTKVECIIVDDGSPEEEKPNLQSFVTEMDIKVITLEDKGYQLSKVRNVGIAASSHENIILLDCDLCVDKSFLKDHLRVISSRKNVISIGLRYSYSTPNVEAYQSINLDYLLKSATLMSQDWRIPHLENMEQSTSFFEYWNICSGGNIGFTKKTFDVIGSFDERFVFWGGEDTEWAYRAYKKGIYFEVMSNISAYHFECYPQEYQVDRHKDLSKKNDLLNDLVPAFESCRFNEGSVPFVSIFVTHYNKLEYLKECLDSIPLATNFRYEIVLVDDCSENTTDKMLQEAIPETVKPYVIFARNEKHEGVEKTFKKAIEMCKGEFIAQLDADDYLLPNSIDILINELNLHNADIAYSKHKILEEGILSEGWVCKDATSEMRTLNGMYYHPLRVFRARAIHRAGGMRILGLEGAIDFSLYSQMELFCKAIFCDVYTYVYRQVENSISNTKFAAQVEGVRKVIEDNADRVLSTKDYKIIQVEE
jgi:chondroitin synthase